MTDVGSRFVIGRAGDVTCGIDVRAVREILPAGPVTRIPGAVDVVLGAINVRGDLVTLIDGRKALGQAGGDAYGSVILLRGMQQAFGLAVDEVFDMVDVEPEALAERDRLPGIDVSLVRAVARDADRTFVIVDTDALVGAVLPT